MIRTDTLKFTLAVVLASFAAPGLAQDAEAPAAATGTAPGHGKNTFMETYDTNKDGKVRKAEFAAVREAHFAELDLNRDGQVNEAEYVEEYEYRLDRELAERRAGQMRQAHYRFTVLDTNLDKALTGPEFGDSGTRMFSRLDTNEDGVVDERDTAAAY